MPQPSSSLSDWFWRQTGLAEVKSNVNNITANAAAVSDLARRESRNFAENRGAGISGQATVDRGTFTQALASHLRHAFDEVGGTEYHILVLYDKLQVIGTLHDSFNEAGEPVQKVEINKDKGDCCMAHNKISRGYGQAGRWGFDVYVFKRGRIHNLGDGGFENWAWSAGRGGAARDITDNKIVVFA